LPASICDPHTFSLVLPDKRTLPQESCGQAITRAALITRCTSLQVWLTGEAQTDYYYVRETLIKA